MGFDNPNVVKATMLSGEILLKKSFKDSLLDRKSTRLNSSQSQISYAVFCLNKNKSQTKQFETADSVHHFIRLTRIAHANRDEVLAVKAPVDRQKAAHRIGADPPYPRQHYAP